MKIIDNHYWLKPFGSHINCINSIYGECPQDINNVQDCMELCEQDPGCNAGYFVEDENTNNKFCVPLYTVFWANNNIYESLIDNINPTKLSSDKGIKSTVFVNENRFPERLPSDYDNYIFLGDKLYLLAYINNKPFYMTENFTFTPDKNDAIDLTIGLVKVRNWIGEKYRIGKGTNFTLYKGDTFLIMLIDLPEHKKFIWSPLYRTVVGFNFDVKNSQEEFTFINSGDKFQLYKEDNEGIIYFLDIVNNNLTLTRDRSSILFSFEKIKNDYVSEFRKTPYTDDKRSKGFLYKTMDNFIESMSKNLTPKKNQIPIILILLCILIFLLCIFSITIGINLIRLK